ncbi:methyltransferase domain-containing protein [Nakamurella sp. YIM 132087]|uniref:Methyltransferase domain-containing protein n=1 Tax=Nakamurella alba TaxID=2665158 RepID=A0A7K1FGT6_9ACTN|nr:class I SAM-dependent methyltransferase [Nakamurella alba]MTD13331.1 methyltransferase domain-containing protein [Nakamurella alba]
MADWDGAAYAGINGLQQAMAAASLAAVRLTGDERVLDIGCGDGAVSARIAEQLTGGSVLGIDPSPRMLEVARERLPGDPRLSFEAGDVMNLPFRSEFDLAVSFNALHWVRDQAHALRQIAAALRPGGRAVLLMVCAGPRRGIEDVAMEVTEEPAWATAFAGFRSPFFHADPGDFGSDAVDAGFELVDLSVTDRSWEFGSREALADWCTVGFADWGARLPPGQLPVFVGEVVRRYEAFTRSPGLFAFYQLRAELRRPSSLRR